MCRLEPEFTWNLFVDEASSLAWSAEGVLLRGLDELKVCYALWFHFLVSNNMTEYEALIIGTQKAIEAGVTYRKISSDS